MKIAFCYTMSTTIKQSV